MSRTKKFAYNALATSTKEIVAIAAGFVTPWVMLKYYGSDINGLVTSIVQFIAYFNIVEAGLGASIIYSLYKPLAEKDYIKVNGIVSAGRKFYIKTGYIFTALVFIFALTYPLAITIDGLSDIKVSLLVLIIGFSGALDFFTLAKYRTLLSADQKTYVISIATIVYKVVETVAIVSLTLIKADIIIARLFALSAVLSRSLVLYIYASKKYQFINYHAEPDNKAVEKRWDALYLQVLSMVQAGAPVILLTFQTNLKIVSVYAIYNIVINGLKGIFEILVTSGTASFGEIISLNDRNTLQRVYKTYEYAYYSLITVVYGICMVMIMPFVRLYTRGINDMVYDLPVIGFLFVVNGLFHNLKSPQALLVNASGMYKETRVQSSIQALIIVLGGILLIPVWGLAGILIALIASNIYRDIDLICFSSQNITHLQIKSTLFRVIRLIISFVAISLPFSFIEVNPNDFFEWALYATVIGIYAVIVVAVVSLAFERNEVKSIIARLKRLKKF